MSTARLSLSGLNEASASSFVAALGEVFEHAAWVAEAAAAGRPYPTVTALHDAMMQAVRAAPAARQMDFIGGHPELGSLSAEEFDRFSRLNAAYRQKFGLPFIVCVRRHTRDSVLRQFERRLKND